MSIENENQVVITGIGIVTSQGVGVDVHEKLLSSAAHLTPVINDEIVAPYPVHALPEIDWNEQISRRGDQRQMGNWQKLGVFAAGLALDDAGFKEDLDACATMDMIVCAGGGERDIDVDTMIIDEAHNRNDKDVLLNEKLRSELRPTLFLSQLSNLMAGNISIVHKVTGSSRTFMGEEGSGVSSIDTAYARIRSGQSSHCLVGGAFVAEREDVLYTHEAINELELSPARPFWQRNGADNNGRGGMVLGTAGVFLVLESRKHADDRGAKIYASLDNIAGDSGPRDEAAFNARLTQLNDDVKGTDTDTTLVVSGASGAKKASIVERSFLEKNFSKSTIRTSSALFGHTIEAQFPLGIALASIALKNGAKLGTFTQDIDTPMTSAAEKAIVTIIGHSRSEGFASLSKV